MARDDIEDVEADVDLGGGDFPRPEMFLTLTGDFTTTCEDYLDNIDEKDPEYSKLRFRVSRPIAEKLVKEISEYL